MKVVYSFNKKGKEAYDWDREIRAASDGQVEFIPFNHDPYLDPYRYVRAQLLDNLYYERAAPLLRMYADIEAQLSKTRADVLLVDNSPPYHPEFLRELPVYRALRISDGPICAYDRDFAYLHAYDHVLYHSPAYSRDLGMAEKLDYCGAKRYDFWPMALFDGAYDARLSEQELFSRRRDVDVVFVGAFHVGKMPMLARIKKHFGRRCRMHGLINLKKNAYFNLRYGFPGWMRPLAAEDYVALYQRSKVGINLHNRGKYTVGNYRMFELPANGVMQVCDGAEYLASFFEPGREIVGYEEVDELIRCVEYFLAHDAEREQIARAGFRAVLARHRFAHRMRELEQILRRGMQAAGGRVA